MCSPLDRLFWRQKLFTGEVMKYLILMVLSFNLFAEDSNRIRAHEEAVKAVHDLHFVMEGRGMTLTPDAVRMFDFMAKFLGTSTPQDGKRNLDKQTMFTKRWGLIDIDGKIKGFFNVPYKEMQIGAMGCAVCHSGKAAGHYIVGLGNKNIDVGRLAQDVVRASKAWKVMTALKKKSKDYKRIEKESFAFAKRLGHKDFTNLTQGLVPISMIKSWFYRVVEGQENLPKHVSRGAVKVPHFWGYGKKRFVGQFSDGFGNGAEAGWGLAVELAGTQTAENVRKMIPKIEHAENILHDFLPPKYPFKVNQQMAQRGKKIFNNTCFKCHGTYERDGNGLPIYKEPKHIEIEVVKTDADRLKGLEDFKRLVDKNPLPEYIQYTDLGSGYFAPRLEGIWARFPYLHNGSVPTMMALLSHPLDRPKFWSLDRAGERDRFNEETLGLTLPKSGSREFKKLQRAAKKGTRNVYYTEREGQSSKGHWFRFSDKLSTQDKKDLIEYLKTI